MSSSYKFLQKLWILNQKILEEIKLDHPKKSENKLEIISTQFINNVEQNIENLATIKL